MGGNAASLLWKRNNREFQYMLRRWKQRHSVRDGVRQNTVWKMEGVCFPMEPMVMWPLWGWHFSVLDTAMNRKEISFFLPQHPLWGFAGRLIKARKRPIGGTAAGRIRKGVTSYDATP